MRNGGTSRKNLPYYSITLKVSGQEEFLWEDKEGVMVGGKTTPEPGRARGWERYWATRRIISRRKRRSKFWYSRK